MNINDVMAILEQQQEEIDELKQWKQSCNMMMAWWGGVCMLAISIGSAVANYYQEIKSFLLAAWGVK